MHLLWSNAHELPLTELRRSIQKVASPVRKVTLADLVAPSPDASTGLYFFLSGNTLAYVGRASSRAIIERVPAHFDTRELSWFGTLLKRLAESKTPKRARSAVLDEALDMHLAVLFKDRESADLPAAETVLRHAFRPTLNAPKRAGVVDLEASLAKLVARKRG
jgi:hypothetical protein